MDERRAHAPHFPKPVPVGYFLIAGVPATGELLALRRMQVQPRRGAQARATLLFPRPAGPVRLYVLCDAYLGLDQQHDVVWGSAAPVGEGESQPPIITVEKRPAPPQQQQQQQPAPVAAQ
ncbi:hypothetical protein PAPYR_866 [Paratrimastix pyriformis]|uniref:Uncharacterized protein n=1 Tax=Paratrimastix pyriformis TaxID=342808 RepID=A0ABQ8UWY9_9EUKA|nr:hypothetical protein PAPYR_866 [Paratrimastix pyriformis]